MNNLNEYKKRFYTLMESTIGNVKPLIVEQENKNFTSEIMADLEKNGFTKTGIVGSDWQGFIDPTSYKGNFFELSKGKVKLIFNDMYGLLIVTDGDRISIGDMGSDNLSNTAFAKSFKPYDTGKNVLKGGVGTGPEDSANFYHWLTTTLTSSNTSGTSKESTPFYTQYYPDIIKLTQISEKFSNFNDASLKDQAKLIGQAAKDVGNQIGKGIKNLVNKVKN